MLLIEIEKLELIGGHIEIMLFVENEILVLASSDIEVMLFRDIKKNRNIYRVRKIRINRRPY